MAMLTYLITGLNYEKDFKKYEQSEKKKDAWVPYPDVHQRWETGPESEKSQGQEMSHGLILAG
ncbi:LSU ribosomal protein L34 [Syntrophus aciditrophicus SB]|jgi:hypothetical protein|uniref:LSU ribosomal protein L34 n=1 Tax=Syntrophus aciditrophicus (strain SB) TaxID=56780 RepID=Q2LSG1_SYNAS|nr:LSU ribosomal protein L34 [Syntrophus aciditrophicus SB]